MPSGFRALVVELNFVLELNFMPELDFVPSGFRARAEFRALVFSDGQLLGC